MPSSKGVQFGSIVAVAFSIAAMVLSVARPCAVTDLNGILTVLGTVITSLAFVIGIYFVLMAVDAYAHLKDIVATQEKIEKTSQLMEADISKHAAELGQLTAKSAMLQKDLVNMIESTISHQIYCDDIGTYPTMIGEDAQRYLKSRRDGLFALRSRLAITYRLHDPERRKILIKELSEFGRESDLSRLDAVYQDLTEDEGIRQVALESKEKLKRRLARE